MKKIKSVVYSTAILIVIPIIYGYKTNYSCDVTIFYDEYEISIKRPILNDTMTRYVGDLTLEILIEDCWGKSQIVETNNLTQHKVLTNYINSLDTLANYLIEYDILTLKKHLKVNKYFQPLQHGDKVFLNEIGDTLKVLKFTNGVRME